jgi:hypothetical protein
LSKRIFALLISVVILASTFAFQSVQAQGGLEINAAQKARLKVETLGSNARIDVKFIDGTKLRGNVSARNQDGFTVTDSKTGASSVVRYAEVSEVKKTGSEVSAKTWIIIGSAIAGAVATWIIVKPVLCDGTAHTHGPC